LTDGWARLIEALRDVRVRGQGGLQDEEAAEVESLIPTVEKMVYRS